MLPVVRLVDTQNVLRHASSRSRPSAPSWIRSVTRAPAASESIGRVTSTGDRPSTTAARSSVGGAVGVVAARDRAGDDRADARAAGGVDRHAVGLERAQHADVGDAACPAAAEHHADAAVQHEAGDARRVVGVAAADVMVAAHGARARATRRVLRGTSVAGSWTRTSSVRVGWPGRSRRSSIGPDRRRRVPAAATASTTSARSRHARVHASGVGVGDEHDGVERGLELLEPLDPGEGGGIGAELGLARRALGDHTVRVDEPVRAWGRGDRATRRAERVVVEGQHHDAADRARDLTALRGGRRACGRARW